DLCARAAASEREARSNLLFGCEIHEGVGLRVEHARLAVGCRHAVLRDGVRRLKADARVQVHRAVLPEQVASADLERRSRCDLELLGGHPPPLLLPGGPGPEAPFEPAAITDGGGRRLFNCHEQVARCAVSLAELRDAGAAEQPECREAPLALVDRREAE